MTAQQANILKLVADAIIETVKASEPHGAPGGSIYAGLMSHGFSFENYEQIMSGLVQAKMLRRSGELYHIAKR